MNEIQTAINAYYDGCFTSRDVLMRLLDHLDHTSDDVIQDVVDRVANYEISVDDGIAAINEHINEQRYLEDPEVAHLIEAYPGE